jgi:ZIP family zinc transporter
MNYSSHEILFALGLTVFAGFSTGIGSFLGLASRRYNPRFLSGALGFSAGVMIYVSFVEILPKAQESLALNYSDKMAQLLTVVSFFAGIAIIAFIDFLIPDYENPHEIKNISPDKIEPRNKEKLMRMGMFSALAIAIHNFPEGLATFLAGLNDPTAGLGIAVAIAIHNIPEGIAVTVPIYYATKNRSKAFWYSFSSGLAEPIGALVGYFVFLRFFSENVFGFVFDSIAGVMFYISLDELLPTAEEYGEHHIAIGGLIAGMFVMALSLILFNW